MSRYLRYTLLTLLWVAVAAYIVFAASAVRRVRRTGTVGRLEIEVVDSSSQGHLVSAAMVRQWISHAGIKTLGTAVDAVDLTGIERLIARNGFVDKTVAYVSYGGTLHIEISQRKPLVRLLTDGMNAYVTAEGYVFAAPRASSLYVPVVTGSYRPPFPASYVGSVREHIDLRLGEIDERIAELEREKYPLYRREMENDRNISALRRMRIKRQWWRLEGSREFDARVDALREKKAGLRRTYRSQAGEIREEIAQAELRGDTIPKSMTKADYAEYRFESALAEEDDFDMLVMGRTQGKGCYCYVNGVLKTLLDKYIGAYRYVVIDNEAGMEHIARGTLPHVDALLLVSDCSRRGVQAVARIAEMVRELDLKPGLMKLIINRAPGGVLSDGVREEIEAHHLELAGVLPQDDAVYEADCDGTPSSKIPDASPVKQALHGIMQDLSL